jgi:predicted DNA-binding transcriptional regulator AlpA
MTKLAFSVSEFCEAHSLSRSLFYKLLAQGKGPRLSKAGNRTLIMSEDAADWRRRIAEESAGQARAA